jgi:hypothetical protein
MERTDAHPSPAPWSRSAAGTCAAALVLGLAAPACAAPSGTWTTTGGMLVARDGHTATLLTNGNVVAAGG